MTLSSSPAKAMDRAGREEQVDGHQPIPFPCSPHNTAFLSEAVDAFCKTFTDVVATDLGYDLLVTNYSRRAGMVGARFVDAVFGIARQGDPDSLLAAIPKMRSYYRELKIGPLLSPLAYRELQAGLVSDDLGGRTFDIGAGDNSFGQYLLRTYPRVTSVIGTDVQVDHACVTERRLDFRLQPRPDSLPRDLGIADTILMKHSLHHMLGQVQDSLINTCLDHLSDSGRLIIFEDTYSLDSKPLIDQDGFHSRLQGLGGAARIRDFLTSMDAWPIFTRDKQMSFPGTYRDTRAWKDLLMAKGCVVKSIFYGIPAEGYGAAPLGVYIARPVR